MTRKFETLGGSNPSGLELGFHPLRRVVTPGHLLTSYRIQGQIEAVTSNLHGD